MNKPITSSFILNRFCFVDNLISEAEDAVSLETCSVYAYLSSEEIVYTTIKLLLKYDADPNTPLVNVYDLRLDDNEERNSL